MRTKANAIRQQMLQNSQNWHTAGTQAEQDYLHQQNLELNRILSQYAGGVESRLCENLLGCEEKCAAELIIRKQLGIFLHKIDVLEG